MLSLIVCGLLLNGTDARAERQFETEILPLLTVTGCNAGACHGSAAGRGGFKLSLFGSQPDADFDAIVRDLEGRRVNSADPDRSLILAKPGGQLDHGGGVVVELQGPVAAQIREWIRQDAPRGTPRLLTDLSLSPGLQITAEVEDRIPIRVMARFDDGHEADVTELTRLSSFDESAIVMESGGTAHVRRPGQHVLIARYLDRVLPIQFNVPAENPALPPLSEPVENFIDQEVLQLLRELRLPVAPPASETEWLRRVTLDLTGRLPAPDVVNRFCRDSAGNKREQMVDSLLSAPGFAEYWTWQYARVLRLHALPNDTDTLRTCTTWLHDQIEQGTGWNHVARELLTATGDTHRNGPAGLARMVSDARQHAELVGRVFLGVRLGCANCHPHPLDRWTQDDYHGLAAVFAPLERGQVVRVAARGSVTNPRTGQPTIPRIPGQRNLSGSGDHRMEFADWLLKEDPHVFARVTVNRLWASMFGQGLTDPADDMRDTNPAVHRELLNRLADDFIAHNFSQRRTLKLIALSGTYGRSSTAESASAADPRFCSVSRFRSLPPEVLADAIADVLGVPLPSAGQSEGVRSISLFDPLTSAPSLDLLGRCPQADCEQPPETATGLAAELHLMNGELINAGLIRSDGRLQTMLKSGHSAGGIIAEFHLRALGHPLAADDVQNWSRRLSSADAQETRERLEDYIWGLLNSRRFMNNH